MYYTMCYEYNIRCNIYQNLINTIDTWSVYIYKKSICIKKKKLMVDVQASLTHQGKKVVEY